MSSFLSGDEWGEQVERLPEADERCCTNQCLLPDSVHKDKGLLAPLCFFISFFLHPSVEIYSLFVPAVSAWLTVGEGILSGSHGSFRARFTNECMKLHFWCGEGLKSFHRQAHCHTIHNMSLISKQRLKAMCWGWIWSCLAPNPDNSRSLCFRSACNRA